MYVTIKGFRVTAEFETIKCFCKNDPHVAKGQFFDYYNACMVTTII